MFKGINFEEGYILPVDKPYGWTSADVVRKLKPLLSRAGFRKIKIGHAGTLDPLATGVLLICIGRATKRVDELQAEEKEYIAEIELGATTPSGDLEHPVDERYPYLHITEEAVRQALKAMEGEQDQVPPIYSAKQIDGRRAYEYAREGVEVEMKKARITIYEAQLIAFDLPRIVVSVRCSKGTYIRSFARDLGEQLASGGHLTGLQRSRSGNFRVGECLSMEEIEKSFSEMKQNQNENVI
jgi:tRNA pseudouridine55 synthase